MLMVNQLNGFNVLANTATGIQVTSSLAGVTTTDFGSGSYTWVDRTLDGAGGKLPAGTVYKLGSYNTTGTKTIVKKIVQRTSTNNYTVVYSESFSHTASGWQFDTIATPYTVPGSGDYFVACYIATAGNTSTITPDNMSEKTSEVTGSTTMTEYATSSRECLPMGAEY